MHDWFIIKLVDLKKKKKMRCRRPYYIWHYSYSKQPYPIDLRRFHLIQHFYINEIIQKNIVSCRLWDYHKETNSIPTGKRMSSSEKVMVCTLNTQYCYPSVCPIEPNIRGLVESLQDFQYSGPLQWKRAQFSIIYMNRSWICYNCEGM